jgi:HB1, ASXL, restriction endonuclease HTH domain/Domain of unknown function (DUF4314)
MAANHKTRIGECTMKNAEVQIGGKYFAIVTNKRVEIQIDAAKSGGGWTATNLATGKKITIESPERLLGKVGGTKRKPKAAEAEVANTPAIVEATTTVPKKVSKSKVPESAPVESEPEKLSCVTAAFKVLCESEAPLNAKEIIDAMSSKGYWTSPGGKTPHATLYSAILRELTKGDASRFVKAERGRFAAKV